MVATATKPLIDADEIRRALSVLFEPGHVIELRALEAKTIRDTWKPFTASGYYTDIEKLIADAATITEATNIYVTIQDLDRSLLARAVNRLRTFEEMKKGPTTADEHVKRFCWLLIDADVKRPSGISATDSEHDAAIRKIQYIRETLNREGWPEPIEGDSGNGGHLLYRIDLPTEEKSIVEQALKGLAARFDDDQVHIDQTVFNPARICKLYGTRAGKGDDLVGIPGIEDRPHRLSRLVDIPNTLTVVPRELLETLALEPTATPQHSPPTSSTSKPLFPTASSREWEDMDDFIRKYSIATSDKVPYNGGYRWHLVECPFCQSTDRGACLFQRAGGELCFSCSHNRCAGKDWKDFRLLYEPDAYTRINGFYKLAGTTSTSNGQNGHTATNNADQPEFNCTDLGNAERFASQNQDCVRWCETWNSWMIFNGRCWEMDKSGQVDRMAKEVVRSIYQEVSKETDDAKRKVLAKHAIASESSRSVRAMLDRAKSELPVLPSEFNTNIHFLNCRNGTLDLRTGKLHPHNPHDMLTRCLKIDYRPHAMSELWKSFIDSVFACNSQLINFMQQSLGMSLSGDTSEQCLFICHGSGSNGKTTLLETIRIILASYGLAANIETFQMRKGDRINNDVAELYGARFVTASENTLGSRLNEAFIKKATGKEPLRARRLHENEFEFMPEFSIWFAVNHKPVVKDTTKGMWRRVHFIPFTVTIDGDKIDKRLGEKLLDEAEGILAWLVQGCIQWYQQERLNVPQVVQDATQAYRAEMDAIASFIDEKCEIGTNLEIGATQLYQAYKTWCDGIGERGENQNVFGSYLTERGFKKERTRNGYVYRGVNLVNLVNLSSDNFTRSTNTSQKSANKGSQGSQGSQSSDGKSEEAGRTPDKVADFATSPTFATSEGAQFEEGYI